MKNILPIGTVVKLKNVDKKLMIFGYMQKLPGYDKVVDYVGVIYPYGNINQVSQIGFLSSDIESVVFNGYSDDDFLEFSKEISNIDEI